ncbi:MAG: FeoA family protein [Janthinobacterium lividum]
MTERLHIEDMRPGDTATIVAIDRDGVDPVTARQLHEMGFDEGVDIELLHRAPFGGDPMALRVGSMAVALRKRLARMIVVERTAVAYLQAAE